MGGRGSEPWSVRHGGPRGGGCGPGRPLHFFLSTLPGEWGQGAQLDPSLPLGACTSLLLCTS